MPILILMAYQEMISKDIYELILRETDAGNAFKMGWEKREVDCRTMPIRVFLYPMAAPACMDRFIMWHNGYHKATTPHPLIMAWRFFVYFQYIHPFVSGNGRVGIVFVGDDFVR